MRYAIFFLSLEPLEVFGQGLQAWFQMFGEVRLKGEDRVQMLFPEIGEDAGKIDVALAQRQVLVGVGMVVMEVHFHEVRS